MLLTALHKSHNKHTEHKASIVIFRWWWNYQMPASFCVVSWIIQCTVILFIHCVTLTMNQRNKFC
jgi:hypothetical protein